MVEYGPARCYTWNAVPDEPVTELLNRRMISGNQVMLAQVSLKKGCVVPMHAHANEQLTSVLDGRLRFWIEGASIEGFVMGPGEVLVIPAHVPHKVEAIADTTVLDTFSPPRQDWLDKTDDYLRR